ncbi:prepilin-type N-terminal cleavage/methylation domain-containing protein [Enterococcus sp. 669A]|uniref:Prepilin-type N-terminal cleavage/methylation domain-containing protein n=1 Tax=Candidatus Enterococcus moelleringii TaxID=2815325 RepID=A0ABS3LEY0_9ENTE|nr:competence type IV pilus minor pilin ComGF [Enterococcus sp. 669A]MBO1308197.1 prepilin-type N-terminal cleavage/methylation domain-containing protein [Enterococcus sp. 669A]
MIVKRQRRSQGFTLLECLVALLVLSGSILLLHGLIKHISKVEQQLSVYHNREWEVGLLQLENELKGFEYYNTEAHALVLKDNVNNDVRIERINSTVRKSYKGGHQPLFTQVYAFKCRKVGKTVELNVTFNDGTKKKGIWVIE